METVAVHNVDAKIQEFAKCVSDGIESWVRAGEIVAEILGADPSAIDRICNAIPGLPKDVIYRFEAIGRKEIHPKLLLSGAPGIRRLAAMPYSLQCTHVSEPISLLIINGEKHDTLMVETANLTSDQCRQVFANNHVRNLAEQRAWLESERKQQAIEHEASLVPYSICKGKVTFRTGCTMTRREIQHLLKIL